MNASDTTFSSNEAQGGASEGNGGANAYGGGFFGGGGGTIVNCTFSGNAARSGCIDFCTWEPGFA